MNRLFYLFEIMLYFYCIYEHLAVLTVTKDSLLLYLVVMLEDVPVEEEERPVITISPDMYHLDGT
jgi:hypothetical protein